MTLGEKIWRLREERGLSQEELAEQLGVSRQTVSNWENDKATPDALKLGQLCKALGVSADGMLSLPPRPSEEKKEERRGWKRLLLFVLSAVCFVIAAVGLILCATGVIPMREVASSMVIFTESTVFYLFLILGAGCLIGALVLLFKRK